MMRKSFLLKSFLLVVLLAGVLAVIISTMGDSFRAGAVGENRAPTFFEQFVIAGGPIVWFILLPMSLITVYLAAMYSLTIRRKKLLPSGVGAEIVRMIQQSGDEEVEGRIGERRDFVSVAVVKAVTQGKGDWFRMRNALAESLQEQAWGYLRRVEWLSLIGNVSPMVGLFGTVFGMIKLFNAIVMAGGQPQPAQLAEGISVALVTTFWGLFIAIPALAMHGVFRNRIETLVSDAVVEAENIIPEIRRSLQRQELKQKRSLIKSEVREIRTKREESIGESLRSL
jgi:biopolymer transport protein ExbB